MKLIYQHILLLFLFTVQNSHSQNHIRYHSLCNQACKALEDGMIDHAYTLLTEALTVNIKPKAADYLNMAKCYSQMNEPDLTEKYIRLAIERNPKIRRTVRIHNLWFEPVVGADKWKQILEKTREDYTISEDAQRVSDELHRIDSLNSQFYRRYQQQADPYKPMDTLVYNQYWDSVHQMAMINAPTLDSILLSLTDEVLTHPAVEESFLILSSILQQEYWEPRKEMYLKLIDKGFVTPDIIAHLFIEEYFGKDNTFNYLRFSPKNTDFYDKYGVVFDHYMYTFRILNIWKYDEKEY